MRSISTFFSAAPGAANISCPRQPAPPISAAALCARKRWQCSQCTLINEDGGDECATCGTDGAGGRAIERVPDNTEEAQRDDGEDKKAEKAEKKENASSESGSDPQSDEDSARQAKMEKKAKKEDNKPKEPQRHSPRQASTGRTPQSGLNRGKSWFSNLFGYLEFEDSFTKNRAQFQFNAETNILLSLANRQEFYVGPFECLSLKSLTERYESCATMPAKLGALEYQELRGDAVQLHTCKENHGAVFMVASQFNLLEMVGPGVTPEKGITSYISDKTQGPACALSCPAATVFRNYMVNGTGQGGGHQLNMLDDVEKLLRPQRYWHMQNGYCLPVAEDSMRCLGNRLASDQALLEQVKLSIKFGIHWDTQVRTSSDLRVCQIFCSALPCSYCHRTKRREDWTEFASGVLDSAFEATFCTGAILAEQRQERVKVYLTGIGLGAFGNSAAWVNRSIESAVQKFKDAPIDVYLVKFGH